MKAALERSRLGAYSTLMVGDAPQHLQQLEAYRRQRRDHWAAEFASHLERRAAAGGGGDGGGYLVDLPEHCVKETRGERWLVGLSLAAIGVQLGAAYAALSLTLRLPVKGE